VPEEEQKVLDAKLAANQKIADDFVVNNGKKYPNTDQSYINSRKQSISDYNRNDQKVIRSKNRQNNITRLQTLGKLYLKGIWYAPAVISYFEKSEEYDGYYYSPDYELLLDPQTVAVLKKPSKFWDQPVATHGTSEF